MNNLGARVVELEQKCEALQARNKMLESALRRFIRDGVTILECENDDAPRPPDSRQHRRSSIPEEKVDASRLDSRSRR